MVNGCRMVGQWLANGGPTVGQWLADALPIVGQWLANGWPLVGKGCLLSLCTTYVVGVHAQVSWYIL